jgi:citrate synthase
MGQAGEDWIARNEALSRLRVKAQTLYAYVSRGRIAARPDPNDPRRSLYAASDVARLSGSSTPGGAAVSPLALPAVGAAGRGEASIDSTVTLMLGGRLFYRGRDVVQLAETATLEDAARVLWEARDTNPFAQLKPRVDVAFAGSPRARALSFMARRAQEDAPSLDRDPDELKQEAAAILAELVDAVAGAGPRLHLHQRLARTWKIPERDAHLLRRALVLAADQGLDAAVTTARVAAGAGASLSAGVMAGYGALMAPGVASRINEAVSLVAEARAGRAEAAIAARLDTGRAVAGFLGSPLGDPDGRATALLAAADLPEDLAAIVSIGKQATGRGPNLEMALALTARRLDLPRDGAWDIWMIGRSAGLLAHVLDQATNGSPIRTRLRYVGVEPGAH